MKPARACICYQCRVYLLHTAVRALIKDPEKRKRFLDTPIYALSAIFPQKRGFNTDEYPRGQLGREHGIQPFANQNETTHIPFIACAPSQLKIRTPLQRPPVNGLGKSSIAVKPLEAPQSGRCFRFLHVASFPDRGAVKRRSRWVTLSDCPRSKNNETRICVRTPRAIHAKRARQVPSRIQPHIFNEGVLWVRNQHHTSPLNTSKSSLQGAPLLHRNSSGLES